MAGREAKPRAHGSHVRIDTAAALAYGKRVMGHGRVGGGEE
jgi:hypothetical protein